MIAAEFGMTVTAEGIETDVQLQSVSRDGCTEGQGYFLDRPLTEAAANERIATEAGRAPEGSKVVPIRPRCASL
jgi:EAL domain-containing protein (putative c-di-GMP-specific phosphodiesterase class I)